MNILLQAGVMEEVYNYFVNGKRKEYRVILFRKVHLSLNCLHINLKVKRLEEYL